MHNEPAIPLLMFVPSKSGIDYRAIYGIACTYAHAGLVLSKHGHNVDRPEFALPATVCSSFAIELLLKFFIAFESSERGEQLKNQSKGHNIFDLWGKVSPARQDLIISKFPNRSGKVLSTKEDKTANFERALKQLGESPFVKWRYVHEITNFEAMFHGDIVDVADAFGYAAEHVLEVKTV